MSTSLLEGGVIIVKDSVKDWENLKEKEKALSLEKNGQLRAGIVGKDMEEADVLIHDKYNRSIAFLLAQLSHPDYPEVFGILYEGQRATYETLVVNQVQEAQVKHGKGSLEELLYQAQTWTV